MSARYDVTKLRADFPVLSRTIDGQPLLYLDSAATALKPTAVIRDERAYSELYTANIHRGRHLLSEEASTAYEAVRQRAARFLNASPSSIVFVKNATEGLNLVARGLGLQKSDRVLTSVAEHHSNLVPWMRQANVCFIERDPLQPLTTDAVRQALDTFRPRVLTLGHASNVTGVIEPIAEICALARSQGVMVVVDASQSAPHLPLDVQALGCDFLALSGHKMLGPTGTGVLWGRYELLDKLEPLVLGGGTVQRVTAQGYELKALPHRLEAGTPNVAGVIGLGTAMGYLQDLGFDAIAAHEEALANHMEEELARIPGLRVIMSRPKPRLALAQIAPVSQHISPDELASMLSDTHNIMVRSGYHCAHPLFDRLGLGQGAHRPTSTPPPTRSRNSPTRSERSSRASEPRRCSEIRASNERWRRAEMIATW